MTAAILPASLRPLQPATLARLGPEADGGYLVDHRDIASADGLISLGVDRDWRFEKAFLRNKAVPVHAYDGCTSIPYFLADIPRALRIGNLRWICRTIQRSVDYWWFFSGRTKHFRCFVGTAEFAYENTGAEVVPFQKVLDDMRDAGSSKPFLKIDIEGAEYLLLEELIKQADITTGLAIEFHDCARHIDEIAAFVGSYSHRLVHIHANPYGGVGESGIPNALELTFSSHAESAADEPTLPHPLDRPNDRRKELALQFA